MMAAPSRAAARTFVRMCTIQSKNSASGKGVIAMVTVGRAHSTSSASSKPMTYTGYVNAGSHEYHRHSTRYNNSTRETLEMLEQGWQAPQPHMEPQTFSDKAAFKLVKLLRKLSDMYFERRLLERACMLETIAAVPGFVAGATHHFRSLRSQVHCQWIKIVMDEAENERMHLMTFMHLANPTTFQRILITGAQGVFLTAFSVCYFLMPGVCHRFVGYLEEEAVHTYTEMLKDIDAGLIPNVPAPDVAKQYWALPEDATLRDVVLVVRADEADHRLVNHHMSDLSRDAGDKRAENPKYKCCDEFNEDLSSRFGPTVDASVLDFSNTSKVGGDGITQKKSAS